MTLRGQFFPTM